MLGSTAERTCVEPPGVVCSAQAMAEADDSNGPKAGTPPRDIALLGGPTERGDGVTIVRLREGQVEVGELRAAEEGKPILGESVRLHRRAEHPRLVEVETLARGPLAPEAREAASAPGSPRGAAKGPAKVATEAYRTGWESIFGAPRPGGSLPS